MRFGDLTDYDHWVIGLLWPPLCIIGLRPARSTRSIHTGEWHRIILSRMDGGGVAVCIGDVISSQLDRLRRMWKVHPDGILKKSISRFFSRRFPPYDRFDNKRKIIVIPIQYLIIRCFFLK